MAGLLRGGIYWADLDPVRGHEQGGRRPVVVLSHDMFNERSGTVIAMALTPRPQRAGYPITLRVGQPVAGREAWVKLSQVRTLSVDRIGGYLDRLDGAVLDDLVDGLVQLIA